MAADWTFDPGVVVDDETMSLQANLAGVFALAVGGAAQPVYDLNGSPIANLQSNAVGYVARFKADAPVGFVNFGSVWQQVFAGEVLQNAADISDLLTAAQAAAASADASRIAAEEAAASGGGGVSDHGLLAGLADDDHPHYLNTARGDVRYYLKAAVDSAIATANATASAADRDRANHSGAQPISSVTGLQAELDARTLRVFTKRIVSASYAVVLADGVDTVLHSAATGGITITLPSDATAAIATETVIPWRQFGTGQITFAAGSGAALFARGNAFKSAGQFAGGIATKVGSNTWLLEGDVTA